MVEIRGLTRRLGAQLDVGGAHPSRTARANLGRIVRANGLPASRAEEVLERAGLAHAARSRVRTFSLGMGQRLNLAALPVAVVTVAAAFAATQFGPGEHGYPLADAVAGPVPGALAGAALYWVLLALLAAGLTVVARNAIVQLTVLISTVLALPLFLSILTEAADYPPDRAGPRCSCSEDPTGPTCPPSRAARSWPPGWCWCGRRRFGCSVGATPDPG
ncbi:hypothetical protein [Nocardiopsis sp. RV163]|uniref:hypothetical protein n=1 Tax=Nocardiopsis sp. RV163 TaxID=1661388 RepID=UPI000AC72C1F|nr:hypothetical protein [Nocardiopsis sp. RV163]